MTTVTLDRVSEQGAIANNFGFASNKLFTSTLDAIQFWLEAATNKENLPSEEYSKYLFSIGWSNRNASPYIKMANFIRSHLLDHLDAIAKLDIRTLIKLPGIRYAPIVEAIKGFAPTQKQVTDLIKKLPTKPRGYKPVQQREDEVFGVNISADTDAVVTEAAELLGFTKQKLILFSAKLVKAIASGDETFTDLMEEIQEQVAKKIIVDEESLTTGDTWQEAQSELAAYIDEQQSEVQRSKATELLLPPSPDNATAASINVEFVSEDSIRQQNQPESSIQQIEPRVTSPRPEGTGLLNFTI